MNPPYRLRAGRPSLVIFLVLAACAGTRVEAYDMDEKRLLDETVRLVKEVKEFGETLGIEPTEALLRHTLAKPASSMLWLWVQRAGTIAVSRGMDVSIGLKFSRPKAELAFEGLYKNGGYSIYYRQGNQFGDPQSVTTVDFAAESLHTKVLVTLHEDLHGAKNFDLPWEIEESLVTPLGDLASLEYFQHKEDPATAQHAASMIKDSCAVSNELNALAARALEVFNARPLDRARTSVLQMISSHPAYDRIFTFHLADQDRLTALEAKISHDLAYYKYFSQIVALYDQTGDLKGLIEDLKKALRPNMDEEAIAAYLRELEHRYEENSRRSNRPSGQRLCRQNPKKRAR